MKATFAEDANKALTDTNKTLFLRLSLARVDADRACTDVQHERGERARCSPTSRY